MPGPARVDPRAAVDPRARIGAGVEVGPFAVVGPDVEIGESTRICAHAMVIGRTTLGPGNVVHPFAVIGGAPQQHRSTPAQDFSLEVGAHNEFREHVTVHTGTLSSTRIGSHGLLMAGAHVGHDAVLGDFVTLANGVQIAGHVTLEDYVTCGGLAAVAQRLRVGESAFLAGGAMCERDVPPFVIVQGDRARVRTLNRVGLERRGFTAAELGELRCVFRAFRGRTPLQVGPAGLSERARRLAVALDVALSPA